MKCKYCDGTGKSKYGYNQPCTHCDGKGFVEPLTNEEWLKQCTTEQLAEWINNIVDDGIIKAWMIKNNCCGDYLESVKWWLKQPHSEVGK